LDQGPSDVLAIVGVLEVAKSPLIVLVNNIFQCEGGSLGILQGLAAVTPDKVAVYGYSGSFGVLGESCTSGGIGVFGGAQTTFIGKYRIGVVVLIGWRELIDTVL
jgi:hypothetical protein